MRRITFYRIGLALLSTVITLAALEATLRALARNHYAWLFNEYQQPFWELMFLRSGGDDFVDGGIFCEHPTRGWASAPNRHITWGDRVHTTNDRAHRSTTPFVRHSEKYTVLVAGDSYTFGAHANDNDVWPTILEQLDNRLQVINLAVAGYAIDQIDISLEESIPEYRPQLALFAYIHDDLRRSPLAFREYRKPAFYLQGEDLKLADLPVQSIAETTRQLQQKYALPNLMTYWFFRAHLVDRPPTSASLFCLNERIVERAASAAKKSPCDFLLVDLACDDEIKDPLRPDLGEQFLRYYISRHQVNYLATRETFLEKGTSWDIGHYQRPHAQLVARAVYQKILALPSWQAFVRKWAVPVLVP